MDKVEQTRVFTGEEILAAIARGSERCQEHRVRDYVSHDRDAGWGESWVFETEDGKFWRHAQLFTETTDPRLSYECDQVLPIEEVVTTYDEINELGGVMHVTRCEGCGFQTQLDELYHETRCGSCRDR